MRGRPDYQTFDRDRQNVRLVRSQIVHDAPGEAPGRLGIDGRPPSESTIRRTLARVDAGVVDQVIGVWVWLRTSMIDGRRLVAVDGKTLRGAKDSAGHLTHRLAALDQGSGVVHGSDSTLEASPRKPNCDHKSDSSVIEESVSS